MNSLNVNLGERSYPILFSHDQLEGLPAVFQNRFSGVRLFFITDTVVAGIYEKKIRTVFKSTNNPLHLIILPDGEDSKSLASAERIFSELIQQRADRKSLIVSFGGGVIGDIAGFVAATYMRGISFVQIPTTLLAMVDSSVGGKVAVNHVLGKNMIGAFHQPKLVFIDNLFLQTLPKRELICGLAEIIKYGLILDKSFFEWVIVNYSNIISLNQETLEYVISRSCELKAQIVEKDEKENHIRILLNFGHTWAHALETLSDYKILKHGEAVMIGMLAASHMSWMNYLLNDKEFKQIEQFIIPLLKNILDQNDISDYLNSITWAQLWAKMLSDKKATENNLRWVLLNRIGEATTDNRIDASSAEKSFTYLKTIIHKANYVSSN